MTDLFGLFHRDGCPVAPDLLERLPAWPGTVGVREGAVWRRDGVLLASSGSIMGTGEGASGPVVAATARLDDRKALADRLGLTRAEGAAFGDADLVHQAFVRWGQNCAQHLQGDWTLAGWQPESRTLVLARDPSGHGGLYYYLDARVLAFATRPEPVLALGLAPRAMDELYLAQVLICWNQYHGERCIEKSLRRLPPAHSLAVSPGREQGRRYWDLASTPERTLGRWDDYLEAFNDLFRDAVASRLLPIGAGPEPMASSLSGGLDSSSVAVVAAEVLAESGRRLPAFTAVPQYDFTAFASGRMGDEFDLASQIARFQGHVDLRAVPSSGLSPVQGIRRVLAEGLGPQHAASNFFWLLELMQAAQAQGCRALLTGQMGNGTLSWGGHLASQPWSAQVAGLGWIGLARERWHQWALRATPLPWLLARKRRLMRAADWPRTWAIHPQFAQRIDLAEQWLADPEWRQDQGPREDRCRFLMPGRNSGGQVWSALAAPFGLQVLDPTGDARIQAFTLSIPDRLFRDPDSGLDRWLARSAMRGRLPDSVRLNTRRGCQSADLVPRLRASAGEVEAALAELAAGPAAAYVDVAYMRQVWARVQREDSALAHRQATAILCRGIMAGLHVNQCAGTAL